MTIAPQWFEWDGDSLIPLNKQVADRQFVVHERYRLVPQEDRSEASHRAYFAAINEVHNNLSDELTARFATPDHLRRHALIIAGYRDERSITCASHAEALRVAAFVQQHDDFAMVIVHEATVISYTAKSQSYRAMGKKDFQESKAKVLDYLAQMIGVSTKTLEQNAAAA